MESQKTIEGKSADEWFKLGIKAKEPDEQINCYNIALELNPRNEKVWHKKSFVLYKLGRYEEAVDCCDKALEINPENETGWNNKGCALYKLGEYEKAIESFDRALKINPMNEKAWLDKARSQCKVGLYGNAIDCYDKVIKLNNKSEMGWYNKGYALYKLRRYDEANKCLYNTIEINPINKKAGQIKSLILEEMDKNEFAASLDQIEAEINAYDTAAWDDNNRTLDESRSTGAKNEWYFEPIIKDADEALNINPVDDKAWTDKGNALFESNRFEDAIECYNEALEINPKNDKVWGDKGNALFKLGSIDEAIECYNKSLEINPNNNISLKDLEIAESSNQDHIPKIIISGFRVYFHLESPQVKNDKVFGKWKLKYSIQSLDDPNLIVPAQKILAFKNLKKKLESDLMQANHLFQAIEYRFSSLRPVEVKLTTYQAYIFLKYAAIQLKEQGFGIKVPIWWDKIDETSQISVKFNLKPKNNTSDGICSIESIINYHWELTIGGEPISEEEFKRISKHEVPLGFIQGRWIKLKKEDVEKVLKFFESVHSGDISIAGAMRLSLNKELECGLPIDGITSTEWVSEALERLSDTSKILELPQPSGFVGNLYPYQITGFSWLAFLRKYGIGACLADDMGLGKTIQILALLLKEKEDGVNKPTLLICPLSVVENWNEEAKKFSPSLNVVKHHKIKHKTQDDIISDVEKCDLLISTYDLIRGNEDVITQFEWNGVILDEAHKIKNPNAQQSKVVKRFNANFRVALTGTPMENRLRDLWSIMDFLNPGYLGSENNFHKNFGLPIEQYKDKEVEANLREIIRPFILRRQKTDPEISKNLPEIYEGIVHINPTLEQAEQYEKVVKDMLNKIAQFDGIKRKGIVFSVLTHLKEVCDHPALLKYSSKWYELPDNEKVIEFIKGSEFSKQSYKLIRLREMLEEVLDNGECALVFTQFVGMGKMLKTHFQEVFGKEVLFYHGGLSKEKRNTVEKQFKLQNGPPILIVSLKAGGTGMNLIRANHVFHFDRWWNYAVEKQATDRVYRMGQTKNVMVHKFVCSGTIEERIDEMIESKKGLVEDILDTEEDWLKKITANMTTEQLRELFTLRRDAILDE